MLPLVAAWCVACAGAARGASSSTATNLAGARPFLVESWQADDGLPESSVTAITQTPDGYLWLGTAAGVVRFDGVDFRSFELGTSPAGGKIPAVTLFAGRDGTLWVSTDSRVMLFKEGSPLHLTVLGGSWTNEAVRSFAESRDGRLVMGGYSGGFGEVRDGRLEALDPPASLQGHVVVSFDSRDRLWLLNRAFVGYRDGASWKSVVDPASLASPVLFRHAADDSSWVVDAAGLRHFDADGRELRGVALRGLVNPRCLRIDAGGRVWIASSGSGVWQLEDGQVSAWLNENNGLGYRDARCLFEDREGSLWVGTNGGGLHRIRRRSVWSWGPAEGLSEPVVTSVAEVSPGRLWAGTHGSGVFVLEGDRMAALGAPGRPVPSAYVWSLNGAGDSGAWVGTYDQGLFEVHGSSARPRALQSRLGQAIQVLHRDSAGALWVGGSKGLARLTADGEFLFGPEEGFPTASVRCLAEDLRNHTIWVGCFSGLFRSRGGTFARVTEPGGAGPEHIYGLLVDEDGVVWFGTDDRGLGRLRGSTFKYFSEPEGLPVRRVGSILDDRRGNLWLASNRGLVRVPRAELERGTGPEGRLVCQVFGRSDGMASTECSIGYQPAAAMDHRGRLWFATQRGLAMVDPASLHLNPVRPVVVVESVVFRTPGQLPRTAGEPAGEPEMRGWRHERRASAGRALVLPPGSHQLEFRYAGLSLAAPEKMRYEFRLAGATAAWVQAGQRRVAYFHELAPGTYTFEVRASNNDGLWSESSGVAQVVIQARYWQRAWFRGLLVLAGVGSVGLGFLLGHHRRRAQLLAAAANEHRHLQQLERMVQQRTSELAATVGELEAFCYSVSHDLRAPLRAVNGFSQILMEEASAKLSQAELDALSRVRAASLHMETLIDALLRLSRVSRAPLDRREVDLSALAGSVVARLGESQSAREVEVVIEQDMVIEGDPGMLRVILENLVGNAWKFTRHAPSPRVEIRLELRDGRRVVHVRDNGVGFDMTYASRLFGAFQRLHRVDEFEGTGIGLATVSRIVARHGGDVWAEGQPGKGAVFRFTLDPVPGTKRSAPAHPQPA